jgi:GDP-L-fucose synthase
MQKLLDSSKIRSLGWSAQISLDEGLKSTYEWFRQQRQSTAKASKVAQSAR